MTKAKLQQRTCVSCRKTVCKGKLLRFVLLKDQSKAEHWIIKQDPQQRVQGRGVYCHPASPCLNAKNLKRQLLHGLLNSRRKKHLRGLEAILITQQLVAE